MRFSIYSELQSWPGKPYDRLYGEVLEQIENADRLGYDAYAAIEHLFFPKFSASAERRSALFGMAAAAHAEHQVPDDAPHPPVPQPARPRAR